MNHDEVQDALNRALDGWKARAQVAKATKTMEPADQERIFTAMTGDSPGSGSGPQADTRRPTTSTGRPSVRETSAEHGAGSS